MLDETINRLIHEKVMGECWHEWEVVDTPHPCIKCHEIQSWNERFIEAHPAYTSSLDAVAKVEQKVIEQVGETRYLDNLSNVIDTRPQIGPYSAVMRTAIATARQRCEAILRATGHWPEGE